MTATFFTSPSFKVDSQRGTIDNATIKNGISMVRTINDFFLTLVRYSRCITNPNLFILLLCYRINKDVIHSWQLLFVAYHIISVENQFCQIVVANSFKFLYS